MNPKDQPSTLAVPEPSGGQMQVSRGIQLTSFDDMMRFATSIANSGLAPRDLKTPEAIMVAMQHGMELGLSPIQALQSIAVINGRPSIWGDAALAIVKAHPECDDVIETFERGDGKGDNMMARCEVLRRGKQPVVRTFSVAQATKAGLWGKTGPWQQYPQRMLQMRARSWAMRDAFPDALKGVGISEEVRDTPPAQPRMVNAVVLPGEPESEKSLQIEAQETPAEEPQAPDLELAEKDLFK